MPTICAIKVFKDNYIWIISQDGQAIIVDAGDDRPVLDYLQTNQLTPIAMLITHHHNDHVGGVAAVKSAYPNMQIFAHHEHGVDTSFFVKEGDEFTLLGLDFKVWHTPGHTDTHLSYLCDIGGVCHVFCGDTLFSGGCGRVFTGTIAELFESISRFNQLPSDTLFYPAHEYTLNNLKFGLSVCADAVKDGIQLAIKQTQKKLDMGQISLPTTLDKERNINVFLQVDHQGMIDNIQKQCTIKDSSPLLVFATLRQLKDNF